ncbi:MAG: rhomboid family intramembrane serine protease [Rhodobacteraceae bacterium]|nr:rhomboid family intramembrane serine protease [Paracoccaceae bacterium]
MTDPISPPIDPLARRFPGVIVVLVVVMAAIEIALMLGDLGLWGGARLRQTVYEYAGFWPGLLRNWLPNFPAQPYTMFLSYGFLHAGVVHLIVNMITLVSLGPPVIARVGVGRFLLLYAASLMGGAAGYGLLAGSVTPMVGASGALFGLAGALISWDYVDRFTYRIELWPVIRAVLLLLGLNVVLWWAMSGQLAWEAHLGGFVAGWVAALILDPRSRSFEDPDTPDQS